MEQRITSHSVQPFKIGIVGAGFSGIALAAALHRLTTIPLEITLFEKTGCLGMGDAYRTPYPFHLLNVRARDMSAFEDEPSHFSEWLSHHQQAFDLSAVSALSEQFVPRFIYHHYLTAIFKQIENDIRQKIKIKPVTAEVINFTFQKNKVKLFLHNKENFLFDKVILALGNNQPSVFPFAIPQNTNAIVNPWDYTAPAAIPSEEAILIVGTGLSMIDTVLTLHHHQHQGPIYAVSRHGLLPLPHAHITSSYSVAKDKLSLPLPQLVKYFRSQTKQHLQKGGDWRAVVNALRGSVPEVWGRMQAKDKKQFLRHLLPYWNIHRHRVQNEVAELLDQLSGNQQLTILAGRITSVQDDKVTIQMRGKNKQTILTVKRIINCLGPSLFLNPDKQPLIQALINQHIAALDDLQLGLQVDEMGALINEEGSASPYFYLVGSLKKGMCWESGAVPEIRKQCFQLAKHLLKSFKEDNHEYQTKKTG